jgi:hypothetical protein
VIGIVGPLFNTGDEMMNTLTMEEKAFGNYTLVAFHGLQDTVTFKTPVVPSGGLTLWEFDKGLIREDTN